MAETVAWGCACRTVESRLLLSGQCVFWAKGASRLRFMPSCFFRYCFSDGRCSLEREFGGGSCAVRRALEYLDILV
jgi:hypothetical protein